MAAVAALASLHKHGYALLPNFLSSQVCDQARKEIDKLILGFEPTPD